MIDDVDLRSASSGIPFVVPVESPRGADRTGVAVTAPALLSPSDRVRVDGKHFAVDGLPFQVKGVTYGSFKPRRDGQLFPEMERIRADLSHMAVLGLNVLRTYTTPPEELLDIARELGLRVLVGVQYDDWRELGTGPRVHRAVLDAGRRALDQALARVADNPCVLAVSVGNEVPGDLVRMHGIRPVENVLSALVAHLHEADPAVLATYANYPTTEYLRVDGLDVTCFNVFLEDAARLRAYLRHLQVVAGDSPLVVTELGLAGQIHGDTAQAESLEKQVRVVDEVGCAGATVFSWTDEWAVAGEPVEGWGFGVTRADRTPKPALDVVRRWAGRDVRDLRDPWPALSVVVCAYNEARLIDECLTSLRRLDYPDVDVIVCDDGSTDTTLQIARRYPFRVLALPHGGLSAARNAGVDVARGSYVAFLDADAHCHPDWPYHLVLSMEEDGVVATGGPNLPVTGAGFVERAIGVSPGGPAEVLVSDDRAEHVPGCNMAFRRDALRGVGGFDVVYTAAGDDVDVCWKLLDRGGRIAFSPAAQVHHHRRATVRRYLEQQRGYGRAERMLAGRHAHRFNRLGQARWSGAVYGGLRVLPSVLRPIVYHGPTPGAPYQTIVRRRAEQLAGWVAALLPLALLVAAIGLVLAVLSPAWLALSGGALTLIAGYAVVIAVSARPQRGERHSWRWRSLVTFLHIAQPIARTWGRLRGPGLSRLPPPTPAWSADRRQWLFALERELSRRSCTVRFAGPHDPWDVQVSCTPILAARVSTALRWGWTPVARMRIRLRRSRAAGAAGVALALTWMGLSLAPILAAAAATLAAECVVLRRRVDRALRHTTAGANSTAVERLR